MPTESTLPRASTNGTSPGRARTPTDEQERNAMRAYLQRSEVRLSTMHRVAVGFISGAGLLFLLPVFVKDAILALMTVLINADIPIPSAIGENGVWVVAALYLCLLYPFALSVTIPVWALALLIRDIIRFYFIAHPPGFPEELFNPRFVLTGIAFSPDESEAVKRKIEMAQYGSDLIHFVVPHARKRALYYSAIIDKPKRMIVPRTRKLPRLLKNGVLVNPNGQPAEMLHDDDVLRVQNVYHDENGEPHPLEHEPRERTVHEIDRFNAALGLAGFIERPLYLEVAKTEVSLVRHALGLRRLVLRYFQALLILLWTALVSFAMLPFLGDTRGRFPLLLVFSIGYLIWLLGTPFIARLPVWWLSTTSREEGRRRGVTQFEKLDTLERFETRVRFVCTIGIVISLVAIGVEVWLRLV